jgi:Tfp pilus assembly protein PilN
MRQHVNLIAKEFLFEEQVIPWRPLAMPLILLLGIGITVGWYLWDLRSVRVSEEEIQQLTHQRQRLQQEISAMTGEIQALTQSQGTPLPTLDQQLAAVQGLLKTRILWSSVLREVSLVVPDGIYLTRLETTEPAAGGKTPGSLLGRGGKAIRFVGFARSHERVTSFMSALEESPRFTDVGLIYAQKGAAEDAAQVGFELVGYLQRL